MVPVPLDPQVRVRPAVGPAVRGVLVGVVMTSGVAVRGVLVGVVMTSGVVVRGVLVGVAMTSGVVVRGVLVGVAMTSGVVVRGVLVGVAMTSGVVVRGVLVGVAMTSGVAATAVGSEMNGTSSIHVSTAGRTGALSLGKALVRFATARVRRFAVNEPNRPHRVVRRTSGSIRVVSALRSPRKVGRNVRTWKPNGFPLSCPVSTG